MIGGQFRRSFKSTWQLSFALSTAGAVFLSVAVARASSTTQVPVAKRVFTVIFENTNYQAALNQPFFAQLAASGALLSNFKAEVHPSEGNYIALTAGSNFGIASDQAVDLNQRNIVDLLEEKGKTWRVYLEGYPGGCFTGSKAGKYYRKHNPFISFTDISGSPTRCANLVDATQLDSDIQSGNLADYSFYVPDADNDGHDTDVAFADQWFSSAFEARIKDLHFIQDLLLITTFDESGLLGGNRIYTSLVGPSVLPGSSSDTAYTHASLLRLEEDVLGLGNLGLDDLSANPINGVWK